MSLSHLTWVLYFYIIIIFRYGFCLNFLFCLNIDGWSIIREPFYRIIWLSLIYIYFIFISRRAGDVIDYFWWQRPTNNIRRDVTGAKLYFSLFKSILSIENRKLNVYCIFLHNIFILIAQKLVECLQHMIKDLISKVTPITWSIF
jgi:hypothetical protein